jgi:hypothetical protein
MLEATFDFAPPREARFTAPTIMQIEPNESLSIWAQAGWHRHCPDLERLDPNIVWPGVGQEVPVYVPIPAAARPARRDNQLSLQQYDWNRARELVDSETWSRSLSPGHTAAGS